MHLHILILGGYGNFGARITRRLAELEGVQLSVAGRDPQRARRLIDQLKQEPTTRAGLAVAKLDLTAVDFAECLARCAPQLVIHAAGPFQGQDYRVARAAIGCAAHYIDLADGRAFVRGFAPALDASAKAAGVLAITGASTVPALSAAVVDALSADLSHIDSIASAMSPGNRTERGRATVDAILGYVGQPCQLWRDGRWISVRGWMQQRPVEFAAPVGRRWVGHCEVPDLDLFVTRYRGVRSVCFGAGLELYPMHWGLWLGAVMTRIGLVRNWTRRAGMLWWLAERMRNFGSDQGAMQVRVSGRDAAGMPVCKQWSVLAEGGAGPEIPCTAAVLLARQLHAGQLSISGAMPCMGILTLAQFEREFACWPIRTISQ
jgi:saccharopine dehydrogenase-like NADP-dependent oxidoreductase